MSWIFLRCSTQSLERRQIKHDVFFVFGWISVRDILDVELFV